MGLPEKQAQEMGKAAEAEWLARCFVHAREHPLKPTAVGSTHWKCAGLSCQHPSFESYSLLIDQAGVSDC